jgi:proteasome accessory factor B
LASPRARHVATQNIELLRYPVKNFPTVQVSEGELLALLVAQKALVQYRGTPFHDQLAHAFDKLSAGLRDQVSFSPAGSLASVSFHQFGPSKADLQIFERISHAVLKSREIEFAYLKPRSSTVETRRMQPYHLANRENAWYLLGLDTTRGALRTFAVSRIRKVTVSSRKFAKPAEFSPETYYAKSFGAFVGTGDHRVVVRFTPTAAPQIAERFWHETQEIRESADGRLELRLHLNSLDEIQRWIMGWADQAEVIEPAELRHRVKAAAVAVAKLY